MTLPFLYLVYLLVGRVRPPLVVADVEVVVAVQVPLRAPRAGVRERTPAAELDAVVRPRVRRRMHDGRVLHVAVILLDPI